MELGMRVGKHVRGIRIYTIIIKNVDGSWEPMTFRTRAKALEAFNIISAPGYVDARNIDSVWRPEGHHLLDSVEPFLFGRVLGVGAPNFERRSMRLSKQLAKCEDLKGAHEAEKMRQILPIEIGGRKYISSFFRE